MVHDLRTQGGAALNLCTVAAGSVDIVWGGGWDAWDACAGWVILLEAGGRMFDGNLSDSMAEPAVDGKTYLASEFATSHRFMLIAYSHSSSAYSIQSGIAAYLMCAFAAKCHSPLEDVLNI